jgi:hypothetical protein
MTGTADRARCKYRKAQFEKITQDEWITLVERLDEKIENLAAELQQLKDDCTCGAGD